MAGRPAGLSDGEEDDDDFMDHYEMNTYASQPAIKSRPTVVSKPVKRNDVDLEEFRIAVMKGLLTVVEELITAGVPVNQVLRNGWTAIMYAASCGQWRILEYLTGIKANINFHKELYTALMAACASTHSCEEDLVKCVEILLVNGASINSAERHKVTALMFACKEHRQKIVSTLLLHGADVNLQDNQGWTALMWAADKGDGAIVRLLLEHGSTDAKLISAAGLRASDIAIAGGHNQVACLLDQHCVKQEAKPAVHVSSELETVLSGLELAHLTPLFSEHRMEYESFLLLEEADLDRMGITKVGVRTKLLNAVKEIHTREWERGSLPAIQYSKHLSCPEATAMVGNLSLHVRYMVASVAYLRSQIQQKPRILQLGMQAAPVHALSAQTQYAMKQAQSLHDQLKYLKLYLDKVQDKAEFVPADLLIETQTAPKASVAGEQEQQQQGSHWLRKLPLLGVVATTLVALWRGPVKVEEASAAAILLDGVSP